MPELCRNVLDCEFAACGGVISPARSKERSTEIEPTMLAHMMGSVGVRQADMAKQDTKSRPGNRAFSNPDEGVRLCS